MGDIHGKIRMRSEEKKESRYFCSPSPIFSSSSQASHGIRLTAACAWGRSQERLLTSHFQSSISSKGKKEVMERHGKCPSNSVYSISIDGRLPPCQTLYFFISKTWQCKNKARKMTSVGWAGKGKVIFFHLFFYRKKRVVESGFLFLQINQK